MLNWQKKMETVFQIMSKPRINYQAVFQKKNNPKAPVLLRIAISEKTLSQSSEIIKNVFSHAQNQRSYSPIWKYLIFEYIEEIFLKKAGD